MRLSCALGIVGLLLAAAADAAPTIRSAGEVGPGDLPRIQVVSSNEAGLDLLFELPVLGVEEMIVEGRAFQAVSIPGGGLSGEVGAPALPTFGRLVSIPDDVGATIRAIPVDEIELEGYQVMPMQADEGQEFAFDAAAYARSGYGAFSPAVAGGPAITRDLRVMPITFQPVQYDPSRGTLKVAQRMRVEVRFSGADPENSRPRRGSTIPPSFDRLYRELIVNYNGPPAGASVAPGTYLIICQNNSDVITRLQPLVDWRRRKGMPVYLATTAETGGTNTSIKSFIQNAYNSWANPPEYVCLVGDALGTYAIPTFHENLSGYNGEGDHEYTRLAGGDVLSDVHLGRLSISSLTDLEHEVSKSVNYESNPDMSDTSWFKRACLVGDPASSGISVIHVNQWIKERLRDLGYAPIDTVFGGNFVSGMSTALNRGDTIFSYRGYWGMSGWGNSNTSALTNEWMLPFCVLITCDTGSFESDNSCRSEGFLRAWNATAGVPRGGIGAIGTATIGTHTRFNNCIHVGIFYGLLYQGQTTMGSAFTRGKYELFLNYQTVDPNRVVIWSTWNNLMGDPAVDVYLDIPGDMQVDHPASVPVGTNAVAVFAHDQADAPIADALVCLYKGTETYAVGFTGVDGTVELPVGLPTSGNMLLTVTKHNERAYLANVTVSSAQRFVAYQASTIDDDSVGQSSGNGDGIMNPGETIELRVQVRNFGSQTAPAVAGMLSTADPYATVLTPTQFFGDVAGGGSVWSAGPYVVRIEEPCPHGREIRFSLDLSSGGDQWHSIIEGLSAVSAELVADAYTIYGDGRIDPGDSQQVSIKLKNMGGMPAVAPTATLISMSESIDIPDWSATYATIPPNGNAENGSDPFTVHAAADCYQGYVASLQVLLTFSDGLRDTAYVQIPIGQRTSDDPTGPDAYGYYAFDNTDVNYPEHPTYSWVELDPAQGGSGATEIILGDLGDQQDKSRVVDMPFPFTFYGTPYTKATVCSNGWIAMGSTYLVDYRNWTLPSGDAVDNIIAPFWDELYQQGGTSKAFHRYDPADHRWIVEWSRFRNMVGGSYETFQAIFYDPAYVTTETGDGKILFQYKEVANVDGTDGYATVGIQNADHTSGLCYTFFNQYPAGATTLGANRAIMLVPTREVVMGLIDGTVTNSSSGGSPIQGATVKVLETGNEYQTGSDGTYLATESQGVYTLRASHSSFAPDTVSGVTVQAGHSVVVDFSLRDVLPPTIAHTAIVTTNDTIGPYVARAAVNDYSAIVEATLYYRTNGGDFTALPMTNQVGMYSAAIPGQPWSTMVEYYIYCRDSAGFVTLSPTEAPEVCHLFYVAPTIPLYTDNLENSWGWTIGAPDDDATAGVWLLCDPNGTTSGFGPVQPEDDNTADGTMCMVTGNGPPGAPQDFADVDGGKTTLTSPRFNLNVQGVVVLHYYRWFTNNTGANPDEDAWVVEVSDNDGASWRTLESTTVSERAWRRMEFDLARSIIFTDQVRVRFTVSDYLDPSVVEAAIDDFEILVTGLLGADVEDGEGAIRRFELAQNRPNPFNPLTTIRFSLEKNGTANLTVFDVGGRAVRRLVRGTFPAGPHAIVWDGRDDEGHAVPSGMYLYRLDAGRRSDTKKMILLQ